MGLTFGMAEGRGQIPWVIVMAACSWGSMQAGDGPSRSMCTVKALLRGECSLLCFVVSEGAA